MSDTKAIPPALPHGLRPREEEKNREERDQPRDRLRADTPGALPEDVLNEAQTELVERIEERIRGIRHCAYAGGGGSPWRTAARPDRPLVDLDSAFDPGLSRHPKYDNLIAILGSRGSGKTTTLLSLLQKIGGSSPEATRVEACGYLPNHIVLPPIDPEMFNGSAQFVLSWVFAAMDRQVRALADVLETFDRNGDPLRNREYGLGRHYQQVRDTLALIGGEYRSHAIKLSTSRASFAAEVGKVQTVGLQLHTQIRDFFDCYFETLMRVNRNESGTARDGFQPLLLISFDDVDVCEMHAAPLLQMISSYLRHPKVVVLILGEWTAFHWALLEHRTKNASRPELLGADAHRHYWHLGQQMVQKFIREENIFDLRIDSASSLRQLVDLLRPQPHLAALFEVPGAVRPPSTSSSDVGKDTAYLEVLRGNLRHQAAMVGWFHSLRSSSGKLTIEDLLRLIRILGVWTGNPSFESISQKIIIVDPLLNQVTVDFLALADELRSGPRPGLHDLALATCFLDDLLLALSHGLPNQHEQSSMRRRVHNLNVLVRADDPTRLYLQHELFARRVWPELSPDLQPICRRWTDAGVIALTAKYLFEDLCVPSRARPSERWSRTYARVASVLAAGVLRQHYEACDEDAAAANAQRRASDLIEKWTTGPKPALVHWFGRDHQERNSVWFGLQWRVSTIDDYGWDGVAPSVDGDPLGRLESVMLQIAGSDLRKEPQKAAEFLEQVQATGGVGLDLQVRTGLYLLRLIMQRSDNEWCLTNKGREHLKIHGGKG